METDDFRSVVAEALTYYRFRGASLSSIGTFTRCRTDSKQFKTERDLALAELQNEGYAEKRGTLWYLQSSAFKSARGDAYAPVFEEMDFQIAFVIISSGENCDLTDLVGKLNFVVRTFLSFDELYGGLNRLVSSRLITHKRGLFSPTEKATGLLAAAKSKARGSMYDQLNALKRLILCPCCGTELKRVDWRVPLTEAELLAAVTKWEQASKAALAEVISKNEH